MRDNHEEELLCYCFNYTAADIERNGPAPGLSTVMA